MDVKLKTRNGKKKKEKKRKHGNGSLKMYVPISQRYLSIYFYVECI